MKPPFHRILPILKGVLVVCGILFLLQVVATFFLKEATTNRFQEINNEVARSQQLGQLDTLSQQLQHSNNHVTGVLSEEGGRGASPTSPYASRQGTDAWIQSQHIQAAKEKEAREASKWKFDYLASKWKFDHLLDYIVFYWGELYDHIRDELPWLPLFNAVWMIAFSCLGGRFRGIVKEVLIFFGFIWFMPLLLSPPSIWELMHSDWLSSQQKKDVSHATEVLLGVDKNFENSEDFFEQGLSLKYGDTSPASVRAFRNDLARVMGANFPRILYTRANSKYELKNEILPSARNSELSPQQKREVQYATRVLLRDEENIGPSSEFFWEGIHLKYEGFTDAFHKDLRNIMGANYPLIFLMLIDTVQIMLAFSIIILVYIGFYFYKRNPDPHWTLRLIFVPLRGFLGVIGFYHMYIFPILAAMCVGCDA